MASYATGTTVRVSASLDEIQRHLKRFGCNEFGHMASLERGAIAFRHEGIGYQLFIELPDIADQTFTHTPATRQRRHAADVQRLYQQEVNRRFRSLALVVKAKLVAVEEGIVEFRREFLAYAVLSNGQIVGDIALPQMEAAALGAPFALSLPEPAK